MMKKFVIYFFKQWHLWMVPVTYIIGNLIIAISVTNYINWFDETMSSKTIYWMIIVVAELAGLIPNFYLIKYLSRKLNLESLDVKIMYGQLIALAILGPLITYRILLK